MTNLFLNDSTSETILPVVSKSEVMYKVYIPKDLAHMFKKGEGFHSLTKGGEYNPPVFRASLAKAKKFGLWTFRFHPSGSYTPYTKGLKATAPEVTNFSVKIANAQAIF